MPMQTRIHTRQREHSAELMMRTVLSGSAEWGEWLGGWRVLAAYPGYISLYFIEIKSNVSQFYI